MTINRLFASVFIILTVIFVIIAAPLFIGVLNHVETNLPALVSAIYIYVALASLFLFIFIVFRVVAWLAKAMQPHGMRIARITLLSLLAAIILYPSMLNFLFNNVINTSTSILNIPSFLVSRAAVVSRAGDESENGMPTQVCSSITTLADCVGMTTRTFFNAWEESFIQILDSLFRSDNSRRVVLVSRPESREIVDSSPRPIVTTSIYERFPFGEIVLIVIIGVLVDRFLPDGSRTWADSLPENLALLQKAIPSMFIQMLLFFILILVGLYLVIVSMIAIPALEAAPPTFEEVSPEAFQEQIELIRDQSPTLTTNSLDATNPFSTLSDTLTQNPNMEGYAQLVSWADRSQTERNRLVSSIYTPLVMTVAQMRAVNADVVIGSYQINTLGRIGAREMIDYFDTLITAYRDDVRQINNLIDRCALAFQNADQEWLSRSLVLSRTDVDLSVKLQMITEFRALDDRYLRDQCTNQNWPTFSVPDRADLGAFMGAFGEISGWVLKTESLPLALLVGMLGTGILGASVAPYILAMDSAERHPVFTLDVIFRGLIAALVIFLAAQAGLIILGAETNRTNSFILLLICLLAAMFSEIPLRSAKDFLQRQIRWQEPPELHEVAIPPAEAISSSPDAEAAGGNIVAPSETDTDLPPDQPSPAE